MKELKRLQKRIDDSIDYIESVIKIDRENQPWKTDDQLDTLIDILKNGEGHDEEESELTLEERVEALEKEIYYMKGND